MLLLQWEYFGRVPGRGAGMIVADRCAMVAKCGGGRRFHRVRQSL
jgi:hypothetical protein